MDPYEQASTAEEIIQLVIRFNDMLNAHSVEGMMFFLGEDCVFENTFPAPDGTRYEGRAAIHEFWEEFFLVDQEQTIEIEEIFACEDRCIMRWNYRWNESGIVGHVRGVDIYTIQDHQIIEKLSYVKG